MTWQQMRQWHAMSTGDAVNALEGDAHAGLSEAEAERRLREVGPNMVTGRGGPGALKRFLAQFRNPLVYVLLLAGTVTALLPGHGVDALVIFGVVLANAIIGFIQESRAQAAIESLSRLVRVQATTVRDGRSRQIEAADLVPGDLVLLRSGDRVPADVRLLRLRDLQADESMLTGESIPVAKETEVFDPNAVLADRKNMAYSGTLVTFGQATAIVVATGGNTELGRISHLIESATELATPLTHRLEQFSKLLTWVIIALAVFTLALGLLRGNPFGEVFIAAVALAVAAIPEGLPAAVTIILAIGVTRMAKRNAIIRRLPAVETLGSTTVICSDKTGTLTKNEMTVTSILADGARYQVSGTGYEPTGDLHRGGERVSYDDSVALRECLYAGVLCNESHLVSDGAWRIEGDPTEGALLTVAAKSGIAPEPLRDAAHLLDTIPFESERQYMATLHRMPDGEVRIYLKGAVERVLALCSTTMAGDGSTQPLDAEAMRGYADTLAAEGLRVLAFAMKRADAGQTILHTDNLDHDMVFIGLQGMIDPPRTEAIAAVRAAQDAGIVVKMITGDHALTAQTIAREIGIARDGDRVMTGSELAAVSDAEWPDVAARTQVFARVAPEQKLRLVEALQSRSAVVAMTGDGVNDAPALKQANIGVAMGVTGTEAAKDAADMVLTDDNFASIEAAVEEGRGVYDNLRKFITWTLPTNGGEGMLVLVAILLGLETIPILPVHVLWINLTTALALGIMLAFEPKEPGLMQRPARDPDEPILTRPLIWRTAYVIALMVIGAYALFAWEIGQGTDPVVVQTSVATVVVMVELFYLFNCRSLCQPLGRIGLFSNPWVWLGAGLMLVLQLLFVYAPVMNQLFQTQPIPASAWLEIVLIAAVIFAIVEFEKWMTRRQSGPAACGVAPRP